MYDEAPPSEGHWQSGNYQPPNRAAYRQTVTLEIGVTQSQVDAMEADAAEFLGGAGILPGATESLFAATIAMQAASMLHTGFHQMMATGHVPAHNGGISLGTDDVHVSVTLTPLCKIQ